MTDSPQRIPSHENGRQTVVIYTTIFEDANFQLQRRSKYIGNGKYKQIKSQDFMLYKLICEHNTAEYKKKLQGYERMHDSTLRNYGGASPS